MSSGQVTRPEFAIVGSLWMWIGMKQGQHKKQHSGQQVKKKALLSESRESNTHISELPQWTVLYASQIIHPSNKIVKSLQMKTVSTDTAALHEALWKSVLLRRVENVNTHHSNFCSIPLVLLGSVFSTIISKSHWFPTRRLSEWYCLEIWSSMKGSKRFCSSGIPLPYTSHLSIYFFWCHRISPGSQADRGLWQRKQMKTRICLQTCITSKGEQWTEEI